MSLLSTLPSNIPGLIRRGSPVRAQKHPDASSTVLEVLGQDTRPYARIGLSWAACDVFTEPGSGTDAIWLDRLTLDLTDVTGRAHAAAWAYHHPVIQGFTGLSRDERAVMETALHFDPMSAEQIDALARLVLRLAGRTP